MHITTEALQTMPLEELKTKISKLETNDLMLFLSFSAINPSENPLKIQLVEEEIKMRGI